MEYETRGNRESLVPSPQEKTALRTLHVLVAARLSFIFSHGVFLVAASAVQRLHAGTSWWCVFLPVWIGDALCVGLIIFSWFASCPYIQLCLHERQTRLGENNPSLLTELLPEIIMAGFGLLFVIVTFSGELLLCGYLDGSQHGHMASITPSAVVFILVSTCACCRGVCIRTDSELFILFGGGFMATCVAALFVPDVASDAHGWVLVLPSFVVSVGLIVTSASRMQKCSLLLRRIDCGSLRLMARHLREERMLRALELILLLFILLSLALIMLRCSSASLGSSIDDDYGTSGGMCVGACVCVIAILRARMGVMHATTGTDIEFLLGWSTTGTAPMASGGGAGNEVSHTSQVSI
eukprot:TRINITY_DN13590_c0_g1_i1.p1 TRINITY_DN13590_c0_g1~~TRINITY_DN13590_c0_g1_i1.p1  ORF type:complete len:353 (+),score=46.94 TRINITY_DN13590_c0_g1_i1:172-1230(+)